MEIELKLLKLKTFFFYGSETEKKVRNKQVNKPAVCADLSVLCLLVQ